MTLIQPSTIVIGGFVLFTQEDNQQGIYADAAARDAYFASVPDDLTRLNDADFLIIKLLDDGTGNIIYQQRVNGIFSNITSLIQGEPGPAGVEGNSYFFESLAARNTFFADGTNSTLLKTGLPVIVNVGSTTVVFEWTGINFPVTYNPVLFITLSITAGAPKVETYDAVTKTYSLGEFVIVLGIPFVNKVPVTVSETFDPTKWRCLDRNLKTGVLSGGIITISGAGLTFDVSALTGIIVDNSDTLNYLVIPISLPETLDIPNENLATGTSQVLVNRLGVIFQLAIRGVNDELQNLSLGRTSNSGGIAVNRVIETKTSYSGAKTFQAYLASIGGQSIESVTFSPGATGLTLNSSDGSILSPGRNFLTDSDNPDHADVAAETPIPAPLFFRTFITDNNGTFNIGPLVNEVDNNQYNPGGDVLIAVPAGKFQVQRVYTFGGTSIHVFYYGRTLYDTLDEARQSFGSSDEFIEHQVTSPGAFSAHIIVEQGITDWSDPNTFLIINRTGGIVGSFDRGLPSGGIGGLTPIQKQSVLANKSTGVFSGGQLSGVVTETVITVASGTGQVISNTVLGATTEDPYEWDAFIDVPLTQLGNAKHTFIFLKRNISNVITVIQIGDDSIITEVDRKTMLFLGLIRHGTGTFVDAIFMPQTVVAPSNKFIDFVLSTGGPRLAAGNEITPNAGLSDVNKGVGKSYGIGVNGFTDGNNTDLVVNDEILSVTMLKYSGVVHIQGQSITNVDTSRYDPGGVAVLDSDLVAMVGGGTRAVHRFWIEPVTNLVIFQYGQATYATEDDAIAQWQQENLKLPTGLNVSSYLRFVVVVQNGAANLDGAVFIPVEGIGGSGGQVQPVNIIDNLDSTDPNSALSANQGNVLDTGNIALNNLILSATRTFDLNGKDFSIGPGGSGMLNLNPALQSALFFGTNGFRVNAGGLELVIGSTDDLLINGDSGVVGEFLGTGGNNNQPTWKVPANFASANLSFTASRVHNVNEFAMLFFGGAANLLFTLDPVNGASITFDGNKVISGPSGIQLDFDLPNGDLQIDGDPGLEGQVPTSHGLDNAPTWEDPPGSLDPNSYISINGTGAGTNDGVTPILSSAGFDNNYNVLPLVDGDLERTNDPSGLIDGNTLNIKVAGVYEIHWSYFETIGAFGYGNVRVNGTIIASSQSGRDLNGQAAVLSTIASLSIGDRVEFATTIAITTDALRKPSVFLNQIR